MNPLSVDSLAKIFSHSVGCLFVLFRVSFAVQKLLSVIRSQLFIFVVNTLRGGSEKMLLSFMLESVWPMFSSKIFIVSGLMYRSLIHLEFICVYGVRKCSNFILFFAMQKLLSLFRSHLFICTFIVIILGGGSEKIIVVVCVRECSSCVFL